jgi:hypothetical protein
MDVGDVGGGGGDGAVCTRIPSPSQKPNGAAKPVKL